MNYVPQPLHKDGICEWCRKEKATTKHPYVKEIALCAKCAEGLEDVEY